jgi:CheY-like chemotaxis protein
MAVQCLLVTRDPNLLSCMQVNLTEHGAALDLRQDSLSAMELVSRRHWDGIVIDCDDVPGAPLMMAEVRNSRSNRQTPVFAVVDGSTDASVAIDLGATFVLSKPVEQARLRSLFTAAVPKMEREHRRYFRYAVDLPVQCRKHEGRLVPARIRNVSEGGLAITGYGPMPLEGVAIVEFEIPSVEPQIFQAKADVVWSDSFATGLRFLYMEKQHGAALQGWLQSLEASSQLQKVAEGQLFS